MNDIKIVLALKDYVADVIAYSDGSQMDNAFISLERGLLIKELDPNETVCHIEFNAKGCELWSLKHWRDSYEKHLRDKERSERYRKQYFLDEENVQIIARALAKMANIQDASIMLGAAKSVVIKKNEESLKALKIPNLKFEI